MSAQHEQDIFVILYELYILFHVKRAISCFYIETEIDPQGIVSVMTENNTWIWQFLSSLDQIRFVVFLNVIQVNKVLVNIPNDIFDIDMFQKQRILRSERSITDKLKRVQNGISPHFKSKFGRKFRQINWTFVDTGNS